MIRRRAARGAVRLADILLGAFVLLAFAGIAAIQRDRFGKREFKHQLYEQRIVLPSKEVLDLITLGYDNIYADWLWLQSIQAFGSGWKTKDGTQKPVFDYFDKLTDIDPKFVSAYRFANLVIADHNRDFKLGIEILKKGCYKMPGNYDIPYLGLYNAIWQMDDIATARWFAARLMDIPDAPDFMRRMKEYIERKAGHFDIAWEYNIRNLIEYIAENNDVERDIAQRRMQRLLDEWYRRELSDAAERFRAERGSYPKDIEDILDPRFLPAFRAPTAARLGALLEAAADRIDQIPANSQVPDDLVRTIAEASHESIEGLPPDPYGFWYFIHRGLLEDFEKNPGEYVAGGKEPLPFILSAYEMVQRMNYHMVGAQDFIMNHVNVHGAKPSQELLRRFLLRDNLGGYFKYVPNDPNSPKYGGFMSTSSNRIQAKQEPRVGARGRGPFPFRLGPSLKDHPDDEQWGRANGYILADGTELWSIEMKKPLMTVEKPE